MSQSHLLSRRSLQLASLSVLLLGLGLSSYWAFTYSGPYRWLAELQLRWFGAYSEQATFLLLLVGFGLPTLRVVRGLGRAGLLPIDSPTQQARAMSQMRFFLALRPWLLLGGAGVAFVFAGLRDGREASAGKQFELVTCAQLEAGGDPPGNWFMLADNPLWDLKVEAGQNYGDWLFVPLVSPQWSAARPVGAVLKIDRNGKGALDGPLFVGARARTGLPGMVRVRFEEAGLRVERALVLELGANPAHKAKYARIFVWLGPVLAVVGAIGGAITWRRKRRAI
jgi:hypothetical protein